MNRKIPSVIMVLVIVIAAGAVAVTMKGYNSAYAESGTRGGSFNAGNSHTRCTAAAAGANCDTLTDSGKHTGLL